MTNENKKLACGSCGNRLHRLFINEKMNEITAVCTECESVSVITTIRPKLVIDWPVKSKGDGLLCEFAGKDN